ncbi:C6 zinc finger domain protein [Fusarium beomiforme]|uniref:C6 zinc finger domain protein n=1 Tax=Fusarium beomiforme TaxID=44412 RepID=A0A9P5AEI2_9HYPO|nr:C6 zinc finger domain protein [Fusarium beomiforme]
MPVSDVGTNEIKPPCMLLCLPPLTVFRSQSGALKSASGRPGCQRCIRTGRTCDGYEASVNESQVPLIIRKNLPVTRALNNNLGNELSSHAFDYYRSHVSLQVGDVIDQGFWNNLVLRLAPTDPAIRHAITAISLMYADKTNHTRAGPPNYETGLIEYNKAIFAVRSWSPATESRVKPLLVCLLFVCIESMLGHEHYNAAKMHILQGRRLLANISNRKSPEIDIIRQYLAPIYLRLAFVGNGRVGFPQYLLYITTIPLKFSSLVDARCVLYYLVDIGFTLVYDVKFYRLNNAKAEKPDDARRGETGLDGKLLARYKHLISELEKWRHAFDAFVAFSDFDRQNMRTEKLLSQRHCLLIVLLDSIVSGSDYVCDRDHFYELAIATDAAAFVVAHDAETLQGPSFTFESEVVRPVYWIAAKCRHPVIRRKALDLLYEREKMKRSESLTMNKHTIAMATRVIEIEEEGLEIPRGAHKDRERLLRFQVVARQETSNWVEGFLIDQKEQWPVMWGLGEQPSEAPTKQTKLAATREQKELAEGLAMGWPRERLIWPYGVTRERRVLSVIVKKHTTDDLWLEYVREPLAPGGQYRVMKEHIRFS